MPNEEIRIHNIEHVLQTAYELFLVHGIEGTTKEMLARHSGLSRKSVDRYFVNKTDCVLQVAEWIGRRIRSEKNYFPREWFTDEKHVGADLLLRYMQNAKLLFVENPRLFVCRSEFKCYVFRNCVDFEKGYARLLNALGCRSLIEQIFRMGKADGSFRLGLDAEKETQYFCESFLGFLSNLAVAAEPRSPQVIAQVDSYMERTIALYRA